MANRIRSGLLFALVVVLPYCCSAQFFEKSSFASTTVATNVFQPELKVSVLQAQPNRFSSLWYYPTKFNDEHVISASEPGRLFDQVYYVDDRGNTKYKSLGCTAPMNRFTPPNQRFDSFNPYGSSTIEESIGQGLLNLLFGQL